MANHRSTLGAHGTLSCAIVFLSLGAACAGASDFPMVGTARAPGADGSVQIERIEGGNRLVTLSLSNLVPPARLGDGLRTYVVWFSSPNGTPTKAGGLQYDADSRQGSMMATTPMSTFTLKITAERNADAVTPSDVVVASRRVASE